MQKLKLNKARSSLYKECGSNQLLSPNRNKKLLMNVKVLQQRKYLLSGEAVKKSRFDNDLRETL